LWLFPSEQIDLCLYRRNPHELDVQRSLYRSDCLFDERQAIRLWLRVRIRRAVAAALAPIGWDVRAIGLSFGSLQLIFDGSPLGYRVRTGSSVKFLTNNPPNVNKGSSPLTLSWLDTFPRSWRDDITAEP
jgi:hypothetical protein